jgi:transmembrane 9 superfamily protein 3
MDLDDLPIWGIVGEMDDKEDAFYIWTHKKFEIGYNQNQVSTDFTSTMVLSQ